MIGRVRSFVAMVIDADKEINADVVFGVQWTWSEKTLEQIAVCVSQKLDQGTLVKA